MRYVNGVISRLRSAPYYHLSIYLFIKAISIEHILGSRIYSRKDNTRRLWHFAFAGRCKTNVSPLLLE